MYCAVYSVRQTVGSLGRHDTVNQTVDKMRSYGYGNKIKSFSEISSFDFTRQLSDKIKSEIEGAKAKNIF